MKRTQIQLPDDLHDKVRQVARSREMSIAELIRRGAEYMVSLYPDFKMSETEWTLPPAFDLQLRDGVSLENLRDYAYDYLDDIVTGPE